MLRGLSGYPVLYDGEQTIYCIMDLSARTSSKLGFCKCVEGFCEFGQPRN